MRYVVYEDVEKLLMSIESDEVECEILHDRIAELKETFFGVALVKAIADMIHEYLNEIQSPIELIHTMELAEILLDYG